MALADVLKDQLHRSREQKIENLARLLFIQSRAAALPEDCWKAARGFYDAGTPAALPPFDGVEAAQQGRPL